jgi:hypothetical protein
MSESLYPHEQVIKVLKEPPTHEEGWVWFIYGWMSFIILDFVTYAMGYIAAANNITADQTYVILGLNIDFILCFVLIAWGFYGIISWGNKNE